MSTAVGYLPGDRWLVAGERAIVYTGGEAADAMRWWPSVRSGADAAELIGEVFRDGALGSDAPLAIVCTERNGADAADAGAADRAGNAGDAGEAAGSDAAGSDAGAADSLRDGAFDACSDVVPLLPLVGLLFLAALVENFLLFAVQQRQAASVAALL